MSSRTKPQLDADNKVMPLSAAIDFVHPGDAVHVLCSHTRWSAVARALIRRWWGESPDWTLVMLSLSSLGALFFPREGSSGLVKRVVTGYSGDVFPNFTPNPRFSGPYLDGSVEVEHWSFLTFAQRMEAAARGLPAVTTQSLRGSSMADNDGYTEVDTPFGKVGLLEAFAPDVALVHGAVADARGNIALHPPYLEGVWGALAAKRGVVASVEQVVDDITPYSHLVKIPAHRVLAVSEAPFGAHPGGLFGAYTSAEPYAEDLEFWAAAREATRGTERDYQAWVEKWILGPGSQNEYLELLGSVRIQALRAKAHRESWKSEARDHPANLTSEANSWEVAAVNGARVLSEKIVASGADVVLAGAGVANLSAWLGVEMAREAGSKAVLTAELGLVGYEPTPADPYVFNHRAFPSSSMIGDAQDVLGTVVPGPGTVAMACLGAAQIDSRGNINSTQIHIPQSDRSLFLVGSGGGNDVASAADEVVVVTTLTSRRTVQDVSYVTSPGERVGAIVTDLCVLEREGDEFVVTAIAEGAEETVRDRLAWEVVVSKDCVVLESPTTAELTRLRTWDPQGTFLRD